MCTRKYSHVRHTKLLRPTKRHKYCANRNILVLFTPPTGKTNISYTKYGARYAETLCHQFFSKFFCPFLAKMLRDGSNGLAWLECEFKLRIEPAFADQLLFVVVVVCVFVYMTCV